MRWLTVARVSLLAVSGNAFVTQRKSHRNLVSWASTLVESPPLSKDEVLTEGSIVSCFPGGMTAVHVQDDVTLKQADGESSRQASVVADYMGKQVVFPDQSRGVVVAHRPPLLFCYSEHQSDTLSDGMVQVLSHMHTLKQSVPLGSVVDCFGNPIQAESKENTSSADSTPAIFAPIPQVSEIALINNPLLTGNTMIDTLAPIGRGQNMLLIGSNHDHLRDLARDFLVTQSSKISCVYASTTTKSMPDLPESVTQVHLPSVKDNDETTQSAAAVTAASAACSIAESLARQGQDTLVVVDTIDLHKTFWDATTRVLVDVFGVDAVVQSDRDGGASSEMRGFYSSLIQRAGQYNHRLGGGSLTLLLLTTIPPVADATAQAFRPSDFDGAPEKVRERIQLLVQRDIPLTAENLRKIDIPIPSAAEGARRLALQHADDLISMSDGQIWLDERLGQQPPMDPQRSITRVGIGADTASRADAPALRRIAEGLRLDLSQAASMDGAEDTVASQKQLRRQQALLLSMYQAAGSGSRRLAESCAALLAAKEGYLDATIARGAVAGTDEGEAVVRELFEYLDAHCGPCLDEIDGSLDLNPSARDTLTESIGAFFETR